MPLCFDTGSGTTPASAAASASGEAPGQEGTRCAPCPLCGASLSHSAPACSHRHGLPRMGAHEWGGLVAPPPLPPLHAGAAAPAPGEVPGAEVPSVPPAMLSPRETIDMLTDIESNLTVARDTFEYLMRREPLNDVDAPGGGWLTEAIRHRSRLYHISPSAVPGARAEDMTLERFISIVKQEREIQMFAYARKQPTVAWRGANVSPTVRRSLQGLRATPYGDEPETRVHAAVHAAVLASHTAPSPETQSTFGRPSIPETPRAAPRSASEGSGRTNS